MEVGDVRDELAGGEPRRHGLVLGDERHAPVDPPVAARVAAFDAHRALVDADEPGDGPHQRRLAGAIGSEQAGDARAERAAQLGQGDLRSEPHRHVGDLDRRVGRERRVGEHARPSAVRRRAPSPFHPAVAAEQHGDAGDDDAT